MQVLLFLTLSVFSATYYVAPTGNDANSGTIIQPWKTIQHAAETVVAGDTVLIRGGVYNEHVEPVNSGTPDGYIVYSAYPGEIPVIDGAGITTANNGFVLYQRSYIKLLKLEIKNWNDNGIWVDSSHHLEFSDCEIHDCGGGIGMAAGSHDFELNRVKLHHFTMLGFDASPSGGDPCYNGVFNDCIAYTGRDPEQNVDGFALGHGDQHDFTFNRCVVYDVYDGFDMSARNTTLNRCRAYNNWNASYKLWQDNIKLVNCLGYNSAGANIYVAWSETPKTVTLQNCTFFDAAIYNVWVENANDGLNMYNCIIAGGDNIGLAFEQMGVNGYSGDYNVFHNDDASRGITVGYTDEFTLDQIAAGDWTTYSGEDAHSLVATDATTQLFRNLAAFDLHLRAGSIAIDKGTSQGAPSEDFDGNPRPYGAGFDIGAYEWNPTGIEEEHGEIGEPIQFQVQPNPFHASTTISFSGPLTGAANLRIFDAGGRLVKPFDHLTIQMRSIDGALCEASVERSETKRHQPFNQISWDGRDNLGKPVPPGIYFCRLETETKQAMGKLILLR